MPEPTMSERLLALEKLAHTMNGFLTNIDQQLKELTATQKEIGQKLSEHCHKYEQEHSHQERDIAAIVKWKDGLDLAQAERSRRLWAFGPNVTAALITIILAPLSIIAWNLVAALFKK